MSESLKDVPLTVQEVPYKTESPKSALDAITQQVEKEFKESGSDINEFGRRLERLGDDEPRDLDGKFAAKPAQPRLTTKSIEDQEEQSQKSEPEQRQPRTARPADSSTPPAERTADPATSAAPTIVRLSDGREVPLNFVESGLKLADRSVRIDNALQQRMAELNERQRQLDMREQVMRDLRGEQPAARARVDADVVDNLPADEDDDTPMTRAEQRAWLARQQKETIERLTTEQLQREEEFAKTSYVKNYNVGIDTIAKRIVRETFPELANDPDALEEREVMLGRDLARDIKLGQIVLAHQNPDRHSSLQDVDAAFRLHAQARRMRETNDYNKRFATQLAEYTAKTSATPSPSKGAATVAPGAHRRAENTKPHENIEDLISDLETIQQEYERTGSDHGFGR